MIEALTKLFQIPPAIIMFFAGITILFFAFFEVGKGIVKMRRKPKDGTIPAIIGAILIMIGLIINNPQTAASGESAPTPAVKTTETALVVATATMIAPTEGALVVDPSVVFTDTVTPVPIRTIGESCIDARVWKADTANSEALGAVTEQNHCLNVAPLGISGQDGTLHLLQRAPRSQTASGIYTAISNRSVIEFKVFVNSLYLVSEGNPVYITFSVSPETGPMAGRESGRFKLQVNDTGESPFVLFMLADVGESNGVGLDTQHYIYRKTYHIRLELQGLVMKLAINNVDTNEVITIPGGSNVFYIGYHVPSLAVADVEIRDITIDGVLK